MKNKIRISLFRYLGLKETLSSEMKIVIIYRYCSFILTSLLYLAGPPKTGIIFKVGVIVSLYISARIIMDFYIKHSLTSDIVKRLVFIETIGITILLLPTGGISSPFLWYALNPVLAAACFLPTYFSWLNLAFYVSSAAAMSVLLLNEKISLSSLFYTNYRLLIVSILITLMVQLLSGLTKQLNNKALELERKNKELWEANNIVTESMEHIMSLYQIVEALSSQDDKKNLLNIFIEYVGKITKINHSFIWINDYTNKDSYFVTNNQYGDQKKPHMLEKIEEEWHSVKNDDKFITMEIKDETYLAGVIKSNSRQYGIIGIKVEDINNATLKHGNQISFLAELIGVVLERFHLEEVANKLIIVEEQNRIASEMHDSVSQQLFSLSCGVHSVISRWSSLTEEQKKSQLELIRTSAGIAMKEIRSTIYKLSSRKRGEKSFYKTVKLYLDSLSKLNDVEIEMNFEGDEELLSSAVKKILYRVICEASGNAIKHGKSKYIDIDLMVNDKYISLNINDNGQGFDSKKLVEMGQSGLGIYNMKSLVEALRGSFEIKSERDQGTEVKIAIPRHNLDVNREVALAL